MTTIKLDKALADMGTNRLGPPPRKGWTAAVDQSGTVRMVAGKPALHILISNALAQGWTLARIVD